MTPSDDNYCCRDGYCCGPGSWCCGHAGPHAHDEYLFEAIAQCTGTEEEIGAPRERQEVKA